MFEITKKIKLFAFDLDGTLYIGENIIAGAIELIRYLREEYRVVFFTNNSSKTKSEVHKKLNRLGIECKLDEVYTSSSLTISYLDESNIDNLYVIGSDSFRSELKSNGFRIVDSDLAENLVVGFDSGFNYNKIVAALSILLKGGKFIVCNEDGFFPVGENRFLPGCGAMVGAISAAIDKKPDFIVGKPNTYILSKITKVYGIKYYEIIVVGDSYKSDVMMALNYNSKAILISSNFLIDKNVLVKKNLYGILRYLRRIK